MYLVSSFSGLALGPEGSVHGLAIGISCTRVLTIKKRKLKKKQKYLDSTTFKISELFTGYGYPTLLSFQSY